jgi:Fe-S oxidoreductase/nitrate reductase gamma subunit
MARRRSAETRQIAPDSVYGSTLAEKFINSMMWDGKKTISQGIFYGALSFDTMTLSHTLEGFFDGFTLFGNTWFGLVFSFVIDAAAFTVMAGVIFLAFRRFVLRPKAYATTPGDSAAIYLLITLATATYLYFEAFAVAHHPETARWSFIGPWLAGLIGRSGLGPDAIAGHLKLAWWAHVVAVYGFIAYVPHSKYLHMFAGPFNVFFRRATPSGELPALDLEKSEVFGVERTADFTWKDNLDAFACMECGRCQDACPAFASDKPLSPKKIISIWKGPARRRQGPRRKDARRPSRARPRDLHRGRDLDLHDLRRVPEGMSGRDRAHPQDRRGPPQPGPDAEQVPPGAQRLLPQHGDELQSLGPRLLQRADWGEALEVKHIKDVPDAEVLFWVGCMGAFDDAGKGIAGAMVRILRAGGVKFGTLGAEEKCCGDSARRLGNEYLFQSLAQENIALFKTYGVKRIVTICPHGMNTLKHEYPKLLDFVPGLTDEDKATLKTIDVISHVELIHELIGADRLSLKAGADRAYTFHDPCYLGRHNGLVGEPRAVLCSALGGAPKELRRHGDDSFCCGAGGGLMWTEESLGTRINHLRTDEVIAASAPLAAAACPFCLTMLRDGLKDKGRDDIEVRDVAQIVAAALP